MSRKINVGCGPNVLGNGWENIDTQVYPHGTYEGKDFKVADARTFDYTGASVVLAGHFLEHLTLEDGIAWIKKVKKDAPGAKLVLAVPAIDRAVRECNREFLQIVASYPNRPYTETNRGGWHSSLWRAQDVVDVLREAGYKTIVENPFSELLTGRASWQLCVEAE